MKYGLLLYTGHAFHVFGFCFVFLQIANASYLGERTAGRLTLDFLVLLVPLRFHQDRRTAAAWESPSSPPTETAITRVFLTPLGAVGFVMQQTVAKMLSHGLAAFLIRLTFKAT